MADRAGPEGTQIGLSGLVSGQVLCAPRECTPPAWTSRSRQPALRGTLPGPPPPPEFRAVSARAFRIPPRPIAERGREVGRRLVAVNGLAFTYESARAKQGSSTLKPPPYSRTGDTETCPCYLREPRRARWEYNRSDLNTKAELTDETNSRGCDCLAAVFYH